MSDVQEGVLDTDQRALVIVYILKAHTYMDTHSYRDTAIQANGKDNNPQVQSEKTDFSLWR